MATAPASTLPIPLIIDFRAGITSGNLTKQYFFREMEGALDVFGKLRDAVTKYHDRANDRERLLSFDHLSGVAAVDVSEIAALSIADELGVGRDALEAWEAAIAEVKGAGEGKKAAARTRAKAVSA